MLLVSGRVSVPKPLSQIQRSTRWLLQGLSPKAVLRWIRAKSSNPSAATSMYWKTSPGGNGTVRPRLEASDLNARAVGSSSDLERQLANRHRAAPRTRSGLCLPRRTPTRRPRTPEPSNASSAPTRLGSSDPREHAAAEASTAKIATSESQWPMFGRVWALELREPAPSQSASNGGSAGRSPTVGVLSDSKAGAFAVAGLAIS